jgi:hypothetical protein
VLELAGFEPPAGPSIDGTSFADLATGKRPPDPDGGTAFAAMIKDRSNPGGVTAMIHGRYKLIDNGTGMELYDVHTDPHEHSNLMASHPPAEADLRKLMRAHLDAARRSPFGKPAPQAVAKAIPPGPYKVSYDCDGAQVDHQTLDLGAKTRTTLVYTAADQPIAPPAPVVSKASDALVAMASDATARVLAGGPYPAGTGCTLTIASGAQKLLVIDKADTTRKDAVAELVHIFKP